MNNSFDPVLFIFGFQPILLSAYFGYRQIWYLWFLYPIFASFSVQCLVLHCHIVFYFSFLFINKLCGKTCISASHIKGLEINRSKPEQTCWKWCNFKLCWKLLFSAFFLSLGISQEEEDHEGGSLWRARGVACHHCMLGVQGCVTGRCWFSQGSGGTGFAQDEELWYGASKRWFPMAWPGLQYTQEIGAAGKSAHGESTVSVNYEQWFFSACHFNQVKVFF